MIDGIDFGRNAENTRVEIEVIEGQMLGAQVMWNRDGKAGIAFDQPFNMDQLNAVVESRLARMATAIGDKSSRSQRTAVMRAAMLRIGDIEDEVRILNISATGAMIDGIDFGRNAENTRVEIEVIEGQMLGAQVMWNRDGKAGIAFDQPFNMDQLNAVVESRLARLAA
jgi:hypothetical protein